MEEVYKWLIDKIDEYKDEMIYISKKIHSYSEVAFNEYQSSKNVIKCSEVLTGCKIIGISSENFLYNPN